MRKMLHAYMVLLAVAFIACGSGATGDAYADASRQYEIEALAYTEAGNTIHGLRAVGRVTDAQWRQFTADQAAVRAADWIVYGHLETWRTSGSKPSGYDGAAKTLRDAQARVINLASEVRR